MSQLDAYGYGGFIVLKKENNLAFNLLQRFIYRRLKRPRRPKDPTYTIRHIVEIMLREIATLPEPLPWRALCDSS
jgi:hypothetical protein